MIPRFQLEHAASTMSQFPTTISVMVGIDSVAYRGEYNYTALNGTEFRIGVCRYTWSNHFVYWLNNGKWAKTPFHAETIENAIKLIQSKLDR